MNAERMPVKLSLPEPFVVGPDTQVPELSETPVNEGVLSVSDESISVSNLEATLQYLEAKAEIERLKRFIKLETTDKGRKKLLKQYGSKAEYRRVISAAKHKIEEHLETIRLSTAELVNADGRIARGEDEESVEGNRLALVVRLDERYGDGMAAERKKAIYRINEKIGQTALK